MTKLPAIHVFADWKIVSMVLASAMAVSGCEEMSEEDENAALIADEAADDEQDQDQDPAAYFAGEQWWDEGPPEGEGDGEGEGVLDVDLNSSPGLGVPSFQLPFPCGQVWAGQTRTNHSPVNSIDFNRTDDVNDPVVAAAGGTISRVANEGATSYGRWIEINHGSGYRTRYAHLNSQVVSVGQVVAKGQKIGTVGSTGGSSGPHLHYEQRLNGVAQKPVFNGATALFFGTKNYTSKNSCDSGGSGVTGTVNTSGVALTIRSSPSTGATAVGSVADGAKVTITCQKHGSQVTGTYGTTTLWDFIGKGYVSDAYVNTGADGQVAPTCN
jgi:hypothetical protein